MRRMVLWGMYALAFIFFAAACHRASDVFVVLGIGLLIAVIVAAVPWKKL
jgi:hypothetical protein